MKKVLLIFFALIIAIIGVFSGCSVESGLTDEEKAQTATDGGLDNGTEYGTEINSDGEEVTVVYETNDKGKVTAYVVDKNGEKVTNKSGKEVTVKTTKKTETNTDKIVTKTTATTAKVTNKTDSDDAETTEKELTTMNSKNEVVPNTSATGTKVKFSDSDVQTIKSMLEVPFLYTASYENSSGVPINVATHVACWMAERESISGPTYASGTIVLDLFNYFAQTVVNFKATCNNYSSEENAAPIEYNAKTDVFKITDNYEKRTHNITITSIERINNSNNYYKVNATVKEVNSSGCKYKNVAAIIQKNKLDTSLGFSVKALKWS